MTESFMTQSLKENIQIEIQNTFTTFPAGTILYAIPDLALGTFLSLSLSFFLFITKDIERPSPTQ